MDVKPVNQHWKHAFIACSLVIAAICAVFFQTVWSMVDTWWNYGTYTHGFVIFPISIYLLWQRKEHLIQLTPEFSWLALCILFLSSVFWLLASLVGVTLFMQVAFISMIISAVWATLGTPFFRASIFPLMYLFFAVPFGEQLIPAMIDLTAEFTVWAINLTGIPVYQEGRFLTLPTGNWEVAEACSGVRYIIASFALGSIFAYLNYQSFTKRTIFILLSLLVPILANGLRAFGIVMIGHYSDMALATGVDHLVYGWLFFGLVMFILFWMGMFWADDEPTIEQSNIIQTVRGERSKQAFIFTTLITIVVAICGGLAESLLKGQQIQNQYSISIPVLNGAWQGPIDISENWQPVFPGVQQLKAGSYLSDSGLVNLYVAHYEKEVDGQELISSTNRVFNLENWEDESTRTYEVNEGFKVKEIIYRGFGKKRLVWEWFEMGSKSTTTVLMGKVNQAINVLLMDDHGNRLVAVATAYEGDINKSRQLLHAFIKRTPDVIKPLGLVSKK